MILAKLIEGIKSVEEIPGVGSKVAEKLRSYFGGDREALEAIASCKLRLLSDAVGKTQAARIIHGVYRAAFNLWPRDVAATQDTWKLFTTARSIIEERIESPAAKDVLHCMLPMPTSGVHVAKQRLEIVSALLEAGVDRLRELVSVTRGFDWPKPVKLQKVRRTLIVVGDFRAYEEAVKRFSNILDVVYAEDGGSVDEIARERGESIVYDPLGLYEGSLPRAKMLTLSEVVPEAVVEYFRVNWLSIEVMTEAAKRFPDVLSLVASKLGVSVDLERVLEAYDVVKLFHGGELRPEADAEYGRLKQALDNLDRIVDELEEWVNNEIQSRLEKLEVKLSAAQFLKLLRVLREGEESIELPEEIYEVYEEVSRQAVERIVERLRLEPDEAELIRDVVPRTPVFPLELNRNSIESLRAYLRSKLAQRRFEVLQELASRLEGLQEQFEKLAGVLAATIVFTVEALMIAEGIAGLPEVSTEYLGVGFEDALEAGLLKKPGAQRVSYSIGYTPFQPDGVKGERVIILTGANSGGKTTLLKTIGEIVLLAQSGLVVYAKRAWIGAFDCVYFLSKPTGMVDAGALEATLRLLAGIAAAGRGRRLVLVDELEAATEAGAAARIMAVLLTRLCSDERVVAVVVSHLAREILAVGGDRLRRCIRVDGIEARGLDEKYNLIVDRNPRYYYLARSTPELVVRRLLYKSRSGSEREFYRELLEALTRE